MSHKITIEIDEITSRQAGQLAAEKGMGFREYLAKALEKEIDTIAAMICTEETCTVTLEISGEAYQDLMSYSGDYWTQATAAKHYVTDAVSREWGDRG